jgi:hypothetical protein
MSEGPEWDFDDSEQCSEDYDDDIYFQDNFAQKLYEKQLILVIA